MAHISDYPKRENCVAIYIDVVRQVLNIFNLGMAFALGLMYAIKKNKSFTVELWTKENVKQLLLPLDCYMKAARLRKIQCKEALKTINKCWGLEVTGFFCSHNESKKTLCQLAHLISHCFLYRKTQRLVNVVVVEKLLTSISRHLSWYKTITAD